MRAGREGNTAAWHCADDGPNLGGGDFVLFYDGAGLDASWCDNSTFDIPGDDTDLAGVDSPFAVDEVEVFTV